MVINIDENYKILMLSMLVYSGMIASRHKPIKLFKKYIKFDFDHYKIQFAVSILRLFKTITCFLRLLGAESMAETISIVHLAYRNT
jgi:hypothetical protein